MSDLRPHGVEIELGGQKRNLLFTINAIDEIQAKCNLPLMDAVKYVAQAADGIMDYDTIDRMRSITAALLNSECHGELKEAEVGELLTLGNYRQMAWAILEAYGISMPDPDEEDEDPEETDPNQETGQ